MHEIEKDEVSKAAKCLAAAYLEDPKCNAEFEGIANKAELLTNRALAYIEGLREKGEVWVPEEKSGVLVAFHTKKLSFIHYMKLVRDAENSVSYAAAGKEDMKKIIQNSKKLRKLEDIGWYTKAKKGEASYHILALYVDPRFRKKGVAAELLEPLLEYCDRYDYPISIEVGNPDNVRIMETFGFETFKILEDKKSPELKITCMVRQPAAEKEEDEEI